jgi:OOP family OmpA-OmpF porin
MNKILLAVLTAVIILSFPQLSVSEIKEGSVEISPFVGYYFLHERDSAGFGLRAGYNFTKNLGLEGAVDYAGNRASFIHADVLYHLIPEKAFNPFIFAGVGHARMKPDDDSYGHILGEIGVGFKYFLTDNIAIRVDIRDIQEKYNNVATTAGLVFAFGGKTSKYPETAAPERKSEPKTENKAIVPVSEPKIEEEIIILAADPKFEEEVIILAADPKVEEKVIIFALEDVHFDFDKSTLTKEAQVILKRNIQVLKENPKADVRIAGYTSASGTEDYNQKLSERRANAVKDYLIKEGVVTPDRLTKIGYGETSPAAYEAAPKELYSKAAKANMRVLFELIVK